MEIFVGILVSSMLIFGVIVLVISLNDYSDGYTKHKENLLRKNDKQFEKVVSARFMFTISNLSGAALIIYSPKTFEILLGSILFLAPLCYYAYNRSFFKKTFKDIYDLFHTCFKLAFTFFNGVFNKNRGESISEGNENILVGKLDDLGGYYATVNNSRKVGVGISKKRSNSGF